MDNNHILIREYTELGRKCAVLKVASYSATIKEGTVTFEYKMSKSVLRLTGGVTLGRKINIDYLEKNFDYVIRFVESALIRWSDYEEKKKVLTITSYASDRLTYPTTWR